MEDFGLLTINDENRLTRKVDILEDKADKVEELQQRIDGVKHKIGFNLIQSNDSTIYYERQHGLTQLRIHY